MLLKLGTLVPLKLPTFLSPTNGEHLSMLRPAFLVALLIAIVGSSVSAQVPLRKLAPGVVTEIGPTIEEAETFTGPVEMSELLAMGDLDWQPKTLAETETLSTMAKHVTFRRQIWALEFGFKPLRMIEVDGQKVYYLVYYVKNNGRHLNPTAKDDETGEGVASWSIFLNGPEPHNDILFADVRLSLAT